MLEKADNPHKFTKGLEELLKSFVDKEATKNYQRIIPDTGKFYGVPKPVLCVIALQVEKFIQKESTNAELLLKTVRNEGSYEARQIAGKSIEKFGTKSPELCLDFISSVLSDIDNWSVCDSFAIYGI